MNDGLSGPFAKYSAQTLYMVAGSKAVEDKERGYAHPMDFRNKANRIPDSVVDVLHNAVTTLGGSLTRRYYKLKAQASGTCRACAGATATRPCRLPIQRSFLSTRRRKSSPTSYESFSPTLARIVKSFFADRRIDAPATKEKRHGAFNSSHVLPGGKPVSFTLLNYLGSNRDVMTLAHELGHGVHGILAGEAQGPLMFHAPIAYCETASVFGEMTTFSFLKDRLSRTGDTKSLLALIMSKIDSTINTVVRQIGFSNFERRLHGMDESYTNWDAARETIGRRAERDLAEDRAGTLRRGGRNFHVRELRPSVGLHPALPQPVLRLRLCFRRASDAKPLRAARSAWERSSSRCIWTCCVPDQPRTSWNCSRHSGWTPMSEAFWKDGITISLGALIEEAEQLSRAMGVA